MRNKNLGKIVAVLLYGILSAHSDAAWMKCPGPSGGNVLSFIVKGDSIFAGLSSPRIAVSSDLGVSWDTRSFPLSNSVGGVWALVSCKNYLLAGAPTSRGIFYSGNAGISWQWKPVETLRSGFRLFAVDNEMVYAVERYNNVYFSSDTGFTWTVIFNSQEMSLNSIYAESDTVFIGYGYDGILRSIDHGCNWTTQNSGLGPDSASTKINCFRKIAKKLFIGTDAGIYISTDGGEKWIATAPDFKGKATQIIGNDGLVIVKYDTLGLLISSDSGTTWNLKTINSRIKSSITQLVLDKRLYAATNGYGICISNDTGSTWVNTKLNSAEIYDLACDQSRLVVNAKIGTFLSMDNGRSWSTIDSGITRTVAISGDTIIRGVYDSNHFYLSGDNGNTWKNAAISGSISNREWIKCFAVNGKKVYAGGRNGRLFYSHDYGNSWVNSLSIMQEDTINNYKYVWAIETNENTTVVSFADRELYFSVDDGNTWDASTVNSTKKQLFGPFVAKGTKLFVCTVDCGVFQSNNNGKEWNPVEGTIEDTLTGSLASYGNYLFVGSSKHGVLFSRDDGKSWEDYNTGLDSLSCYKLCVKSDTLFARTLCGLWYRPISEITSTVTNTQNQLKVEQSFKVLDLSNRNLKIKFEQIQLGILELSIYGLSGKKIKSISFDHSMMSPQTITIPLESITSGCYLIKLQTGNHIYTEMVTFGGI